MTFATPVAIRQGPAEDRTFFTGQRQLCAALERLIRVWMVALATSTASLAAHGQMFPLMESFRTGVSTASIRESAAKLPENRALYQLTPAQRDMTRSWYEGMSQTDEPPYPLHGPSLLNAGLRSLARNHHVTGELALVLSVDEVGAVTEITVVHTPDRAFGRLAIASVRGIRFSPGLCASLPCKLQYPVALLLK